MKEMTHWLDVRIIDVVVIAEIVFCQQRIVQLYAATATHASNNAKNDGCALAINKHWPF